MIRALTNLFSTKETHQTQQMVDAKTPQVRNSAGGFGWEVDQWARLERFLVLGSSRGSYYASPRALTFDNAEAVVDCLAGDGPRAVESIAAISESGRAPRNAPAIFALAMALKLGDEQTRRAAAAAVPRVCRTGTHLFELATAVQAFGGWGRATRRAFAGWYRDKRASAVAYQALKYRQRDGWSHRDILRKAHVRPPSAEHDAVLRWACRGWEGELPADAPADAMRQLWAVERAGRATKPRQIVHLIREFGLVREAIPTQLLNDARVWEALLQAGRGMPLGALLRNLGKMSAVGLFDRSGQAVTHVVETLGDPQRLRRARVHPLAILVALNTYRRGAGVRGRLSWRPHARVLDALDAAFELSFQVLEPTGRRWLLALDVSGSMDWSEVAGMTGITPRIGAAAMAMATARTESAYDFVAFSHELRRVDLSARMRLDKVVDTLSKLPMGGTDCALPMVWARENRVPVDVFAVYTDSETWFGQVHPVQALRAYRQAMGIDARLVVCGMVSNGFTIADPDDAGMLDVVGFDTAAPAIMADFARA